MKEEIRLIKNALRILGALYVNSVINGETAEITFSYKERNYKLHIDTKNQTMMLEQTESEKGIYIDDDTLGLLEDIRAIKEYSMFEHYKINAISFSSEFKGDFTLKKMQVTKDTRNKDIVLYINIADFNLSKQASGEIIQYDAGLNLFDRRIFKGEWLDDFDEKIKMYSNEDIYIIYSTLISYFYKITSNIWNDYKIDIFMIDLAIEKILVELKRRNIDIDSWYNYFSEYFNKEQIEKYLDQKDKGKTLIK